ncbi:MAG: rhodanese-like domain-containing protein [Gammaproteobacteria bacterium]|nr:rhodanese-like domain-containing protein [Gammaproteobacteria bacterium]MDH5799649.1 rhodanese-like domain-containing protein [Gammaproteobacteria bacterium]
MFRHCLFSKLGLLILLMTWAVPLVAAPEKVEFPGRALYPLVPVMELEELQRRFNEVIVVDVRSAYEFETLRIKGAVNIPLSSPTYVERMRTLRAKEIKPIVVYCNGKTCMKSYKAALKCSVNKIQDVHAFDAGIMDWARTYPENAVLLGKSPVSRNKLISKNEFNRHLLSPDAYGEEVANSGAIVIDVRDRFQREGLSLFVGRERRAYLDDKRSLDRYIDKAKRENKTLLVHDAAGKQVRWLQYYLKEKGVKSYYFMKGGTAAYYDQLKSEFVR